ncbi:MAG: SpoIIE family protein phosphatase [Geobacteraceae bacterium]|nr:SpoIIE family protein phosphatase [Geobacteraceae bacterium]
MLKNRGIAFKLILLCCASSAFIFLVIFGYTYRFSRDTIEKDTRERAISLAQNAVNRIETILRSVENIPEGMASVLENCTLNRQEMLRLLRASVLENPEVYGAMLAFEPYALDGKTRYFAPYFYRGNGTIKATAPYTRVHFDWSWYQDPKQSGRPEWSEPYFDTGFGNIVMATYSVPFYRLEKGKERFRGVVTADISLDQLSKIVSSIKILDSGFGILISKSGTIVTHPDRNLILKETIFSLAEKRGDPRITEVGRQMIAGKSGFAPYPVLAAGKPSWVYYSPIPSSNWSLAVIFPENELAKDLATLHRVVIFLGCAGLLLLCLAVILIARSITRPLRAMAEASEAIASGNLDIELPAVRSHDEVGKLTESFRAMKTALKDYIRKVAESAAERERITSELNIAREIQMNILPRAMPDVSEQAGYDLHAQIEPAREVGGDFYDFFPIDDNRLCFVIADVSGKGVPAALFMAMSMTLLKATARQGLSPEKILSRVNEELSRDNDVNMFVTVFCGILDRDTGEVVFANAGHNHPLVMKQSGEVAWLKTVNGLALGVMEGAAYRRETLTLGQGDTLFLYTDGVTEAMNPGEELFSDERLQLCLQSLAGHTPREINGTVLENVSTFAADAPQSDDITVMTIAYTGL